VTLIDAGPLVALIDSSDVDHQRCLAASQIVEGDMLVTWACFTEAMYLVGREGGYKLQEAIWRLQRDGLLNIHTASANEIARMHELMSRYRDAPMDLADASIVAAYETLYSATVFTLDGHFYAYRTASGHALDLVSLVS
jgi:predicted nucleic acid-binding protein